MEITPFDLPRALAANNELVAQRQQQQDQNAFSQAVPMLQSDPQNAFATAARTSPNAALKLLPYIKQMDDQKRAQAADRAETLGKLLYSLKSTYPDPVIRKAVAQSKAAELAAHGITPDQIAGADYSDNGIQVAIGGLQSLKDQIAQANADRTAKLAQDKFDYDKTKDAATGKEAERHNKAMEAKSAGGGGPGGGKTINERMMNTLLEGDPSTAGYQAAYSFLSKPRLTINSETGQAVTITQDLSWARPPTNGSASQPRVTVGGQVVPPKQTQEQKLAAGFADRMEASAKILNEKAASLANASDRGKDAIPFVGNYMVSDTYQSASQAKNDWINAQLRRESGAAIGPQEYANADKQYFPVPGDSEATIAQKARNRAVAEKAMRRSGAAQVAAVTGDQPSNKFIDFNDLPEN